ncbi:hypothetical protein BGZ76_001076 [Entomortierella beljakovae]|nr:hypothetical protein BGZ76_001076 [Entomortierella beljakovae]
MSSNKKRSTNEEWKNNGEGSSSGPKRVRFGRDKDGPVVEEVDDSDLLEQRKSRRGRVTVVEYNKGEESSDDEEYSKKKEKKPIDEVKDNPEGDISDEDDMFADPDEIEKRKLEKLKKKKLNDKKKGKSRDDDNDDPTLAEIQEDLDEDELDEADYDSDGNLKIEGFNMKEELEEGGEVDEAGNFIRKLDPDRFHDNWLEGVSRKEILAAHKAHERKEQMAKLEERKAAANSMSETDIYFELVNILKPGENVLEALQREGGGKKQGSKGAKKKRKPWQKNKKTDDMSDVETNPESEEDIKRKKAIEKLTDLCDQMMAKGHFDIYEETYEQVVRALRRADVIPDDWIIGTPVRRVGDEAQDLDDDIFSTDVSWEYKWATPAEGQNGDEIFGPFSGVEMKSWNEQGFFSQGILARRVGDSTFEPGSSISF